ncbi:hypothetical protein [Luteibacter sp. RCC_6_2]|uniref:hypothetical protein n=1 Tax=Luteibacter sp. RCC_6_2 TaxID=3239223 RepID=UPI003523F2E5
MKIALFLVLACLGLAASYVTLQLRYGWYLMNEDARFLDIGFFFAVGTIVALWALFPNRVTVAIVAAMAFLFPPALKPEIFPVVDIPFAALSLIPIAVLVLATHVRRVWFAGRRTA